MNRALPALRAGSAFLPTGRCRIIEPSGCWISLVDWASPGSVNTGVRAPSCSSAIVSVSSGEPCGSIRSSRSPVWPMSGPGLVKREGRPLLPTGHEPHAARDQQEQDEDRQDLTHPRDSTGGRRRQPVRTVLARGPAGLS